MGCRRKAAKSDLLRVVAVQTPTGTLVDADRLARRPGRGAYLHPDRACLDLALRRRSLPRALRVPGPVDTAPLAAALEQQDGRPAPAGTAPTPAPPTAGG